MSTAKLNAALSSSNRWTWGGERQTVEWFLSSSMCASDEQLHSFHISSRSVPYPTLSERKTMTVNSLSATDDKTQATCCFSVWMRRLNVVKHLGTSKLKSRSSPYLIDNFSIFYYLFYWLILKIPYKIHFSVFVPQMIFMQNLKAKDGQRQCVFCQYFALGLPLESTGPSSPTGFSQSLKNPCHNHL